MKKLMCVLLVCVALKVSAGPDQVGAVNMISNRNIDSGANYVNLKTGTDLSNEFLRKHKATTLDQAINNVVSEVAGGEFLKNVKIYYDNGKWSVQGDVWGIATAANFEGFKIGDSVMVENSLLKMKKDKFYKGVIVGFKDRKGCLVKDESGSIKEVEFKNLSKAEN